MTVFMTFAMGPKEAYFFNSPTHWAWHNLPPDVEALFTKTPPIKDVLELALGTQGTYFISYRDHDGQVLCRHYNLPNPLVEYLYHSHPHVIRDLSTLSITIGPYESYYAHDKTSASWGNLPSSLEKAILSRLESQDAWKTVWKGNGSEAPSFVSLGDDGSYFMRTVGGGGSWDLKSKADGMVGTNKYLDESPNFQGIAGLYLFPNFAQCYVLLLTSGKAFSNLPEHTWPDYNKMAPSLPSSIQTSAPIPPVPQPRPQSQPQTLQQPQVQFQQPQISQQPQAQFQQPGQFARQQPLSNTGCCPLGATMQPMQAHNCCPPQNQRTVFASPLPPPYNNPQPSAFYSPNAVQGAYAAGQQMGVVHQQSSGPQVQRFN